ncbi:MAG: YdeI/OmpD-associated family protein [Bacteroidetes bacterium]|nr:YdeI/OmpD-associated family protein [Bacteroidota bacterium]
MASSAQNPDVSPYFQIGCGRCPRGGTPECSVLLWPDVLVELRKILLETGLKEVKKWSVPVYVNASNKNIAPLGAFRNHCVISFFKGALLNDANNVLESPGSNSQSTRQMRFTSSEEVLKSKNALIGFLKEVVELEDAGKRIEFKKIQDYSVPEEFTAILNREPEFQKAFEALTPGRRRAYLMHFSQPKQSKTRQTRIEKSRDNILAGLGLNDHYRMKKP